MNSVAIVTDSTADLPADVTTSAGIAVVPLTVRFGDDAFLDGVEITASAFLQRLRTSPELPKTSQPAVTDFESTYQRLLEDGCDVLTITIASGLSGTFNAARLASEAVDPSRIRVLESGGVGMQLGVAVIEAAEAAGAGQALDDVTATAIDAISRARLLTVLDTLDYVYKGGRIGKASHLVGSMLSIKPILAIRDGVVHPVERARTWRKALNRLVELTEAYGPLERLIIGHAGNPEDAAELARRLAHLVPADRLLVAEAGPVLSTYAGPRAVATGVLLAKS